ncbi:NADPH:adrenodoxin oxidoreductase, mitochondrial isoform X3 [Athalia rosae]|uniref:NADPH:adrenodoxin oxidoreductase, mitochondrial isoform X3 n=1 Tax=Athalia rosae TaxID=37344 RepID=UPI0020349EF9|nr:NADPH:adrenodoxin oxidoreductase, mitochondrial isoform X3 [Athalia rosae]XP_020706657.2 NADPH:adrenodoxin oxidoreductase, mitochondrial isoform X3 [Athalia rosae]XP_048506925.1 NADPH:adrenodoxin oxidoreductase, mitochondrial isoform X3 [Athalia rosae]
MRSSKLYNHIRHFSSQQIVPQICIIGAGPAGFYATQQIIKTLKDARVDILDRLPVPFGLVRFGVAPDHPEVKNVIHTFHKTAKNPNVNFFGNVNVGRDVTINQLRKAYHAVVLAYGAEQDRELHIPGENLKNVISGRQFVGWYNGLPNEKDLKIDLSVDEAAICGQGNVAMDIARILLTPIDKLKNTDITNYALETLSRSKVRKVWLIGRRGPLQAAFTIKELRELIKLEDCETQWRTSDFDQVRDYIPNLARPRKRLTELMLKSLDEFPTIKSECKNVLAPVFFRSPVEFQGADVVENLRSSINELVGNNIAELTAKSTDKYEDIKCGLALRCIGYKSVQVDPNIPFDSKNGRVKAQFGKIDENFYAAGWLATGPVGVILSTMTNAFEVSKLLCTELKCEKSKPGWKEVSSLLNQKGVQIVTYNDWEKIDQVEQQRGKAAEKPREKIVDISEMLEIAAK